MMSHTADVKGSKAGTRLQRSQKKPNAAPTEAVYWGKTSGISNAKITIRRNELMSSKSKRWNNRRYSRAYVKNKKRLTKLIEKD